MGNSLKFHLTDGEVEAVREAMNHDPRPEVRQRATAIHLLHLNHRPAEVAEMIAVTAATIVSVSVNGGLWSSVSANQRLSQCTGASVGGRASSSRSGSGS